MCASLTARFRLWYRDESLHLCGSDERREQANNEINHYDNATDGGEFIP